jgi:glutathione peroxidase
LRPRRGRSDQGAQDAGAEKACPPADQAIRGSKIGGLMGMAPLAIAEGRHAWRGQEEAMTAIQDVPLKTISGDDAKLGDYAGKVLLVVNVASKCGLTPQYEALEKLYKERRDQGLVVLGFPANDFGAQEPGTNPEIQDFCTTNYGVDFPMFAKIAVTGPEQHPLYEALTTAYPEAASNPGENFRERLQGYGMTPNPAPGILWNFEKFVVDKRGQVVARFAPNITPDDPIVQAAIDKALAA